MSEATTQTTTTLSIADVPPAPTKAHQRADGGERAAKEILLNLGLRLRLTKRTLADARARGFPQTALCEMQGEAHEARNAFQAAKATYAECGFESKAESSQAPVKTAREERTIAKLPEICYALVASNERGRRIVAIKAGERGHHATRFDSSNMELAQLRVLVDRLSVVWV